MASLRIAMADVGRPFPRVSVVIPTHDRAHLLHRAITSVLRQIFTDFEILVVDDASTDGTDAVVASFRDRRIRWLPLSTRGGPGRTRNYGMHAARGDLIAFLDSDDEWLPSKLERQVCRLRQSADPERTLVYCLYARRDALTGRTVVPPRIAPEGSCFADLTRGWTFVTSAALLSRSALLATRGFDERLAIGEDHDLWLRLANAGVQFAAVPDELVVVHHHFGPHQSADPGAQRLALRLLDAKWKATIRRVTGESGYRRWRGWQYTQLQMTQFLRVREASSAGARWTAWRECLAMCRSLPWSRRFLLQALVLLVFGKAGYRALARMENLLRPPRCG
jgi:glycosyltransferase involved in cell wall biosynthesis